jgi:putative phosphoribosyl transferase
VRHRPLLRDRDAAGLLLGERLVSYAGRDDVVVLGLPRGGVPVAAAIARRLGAPLDALAVTKLGLPGQEELAMGALAAGGSSVLNPEVIAGARVPQAVLAGAIAEGQGDLERDERRYRGDRPPLDLHNRIVILVDDGLATGATMRAAVAAVRARSADRIVVAVPVAPPSTCTVLRAEADEVVCLVTPQPFFGVGAWYEDFEQVSDETVRVLLAPAFE